MDQFLSSHAPIEYAHLDFSRAVNPWHDIHMLNIEAMEYMPHHVPQLNTDWMELLHHGGLAILLVGIMVVLVAISNKE